MNSATLFQYMPFPAATQSMQTTTPPWASELLSKFEVMSTKINSIDEIKRSVSSIDSKMSEMKSEISNLSGRVTEVENSQSFISKNIRGKYETNKEK